MKYDGVDLYSDNHHTFEIKDQDSQTGELIGKISPHIRVGESFELKLLQRSVSTTNMLTQMHPLVLTIKVHHNKKASYIINVLTKITHYEFEYRTHSDQYPIRIIFHCRSIECE